MKKAKKQRIIYKENGAAKVRRVFMYRSVLAAAAKYCVQHLCRRRVLLQAAELEEFLFGAGNDPTALFDREREEGEDTIAELVKQVG